MPTFYEEIAGGYYENRALFVLIDGAMRSLGIVPVGRDEFREQGLVPVEGEGHLLVANDYVLVSPDQSLVGFLETWQSHGGRSPYYHDNIIFDFILPKHIIENLVNAVEAACREHGVQFTRVPEATPPPPKPWWSQAISKIAKW